MLKFQLLHFGCHSLHFFLKAIRNPHTHAALNVFALADRSLRGEAFCGSMTKCLLPDASSFCCVSCSLCFSFFFIFDHVIVAVHTEHSLSHRKIFFFFFYVVVDTLHPVHLPSGLGVGSMFS